MFAELQNTYLVHKSSNWVILINDWHNCSIHLSFMHCPCRQFYSFTTAHGHHSWEVLPFTLSFLVSIVLWKLHVSNMKSICEVLNCIQQLPPIDVAIIFLGTIMNDATSDFFFNKKRTSPNQGFLRWIFTTWWNFEGFWGGKSDSNSCPFCNSPAQASLCRSCSLHLCS